jgi:hypothetical protein
MLRRVAPIGALALSFARSASNHLCARNIQVLFAQYLLE